MSTPTRVGGFLLALAATFAVAIGLGSLVGPIGASADGPNQAVAVDDTMAGHGTGAESGPVKHTDHESPDGASVLIRVSSIAWSASQRSGVGPAQVWMR